MNRNSSTVPTTTRAFTTETTHDSHDIDAESPADAFGHVLREHAPQHVLPAPIEGGVLWIAASTDDLRVSA